MEIELSTLRRQLRHLPVLSVTGGDQLFNWYLNSTGMPVLMAPLVFDGGLVELSMSIGDLLVSWTAAPCGLLTEPAADERDRRYTSAFNAKYACLPLRVERCLAERLSTDVIELAVIDYDALQLGNPFAGAVETRMVDHMNDDHVDALCAYCGLAAVAIDGHMPSMIGIDADGFDLLVRDRLVRIDFDAPSTTPMDARKALMDLAGRGREVRTTPLVRERRQDA